MIIYPSNKELYFALEDHMVAIKRLQKEVKELRKKLEEKNGK